MRRAAIAVLLAAMLLGAGCASITWNDTDPTQTPGTSGPDPAEDVIGWEAGYWHNDSITIDQSDGLNDTELDAYVARGMARVEYIRNREFTSDVPVTVMSRAEYLSRTSGNNTDSAFAAWNNQVWEGLWIIGEDTSYTAAIQTTRGSSVAGFYSPSNDAITIITETPESPTINNATLIHELVHALQDQYIGLNNPQYSGVTQDGQLAASSLIEGEANYVEARYSQRCGGAWACVASAGGGGDSGLPQDFNFGLFITIFTPYSDGPVWVAHQIEQGGWDHFEQAYSNVPVSTEQIIHLTNESPTSLSYDHAAVNGWEPFPAQGIDGADTVGEASIFAMFWYQSRSYGADVLDWRSINNVDSPYDIYNYNSTPSNGWANDLLVPYQKGSGSDAEYGYVWKTEWDTVADATEFRTAYETVLQTHNATQPSPDTWVVPNGPFADAFHVIQNDSTVTIVNGPDVTAVENIRTDTPPQTASTTTTTTTGETGPGFTLIAALVAVSLVLVGVWRRE